ncbi:MAG: serine/threonine-protein kinase [Thermoguttaceae bacterium]|jgi:serine/threonine-protein kinase
MSEPASKSSESAVPADLSGQQLGDFQLLRRLGRGAMAEVYLAEQQQLKRRVAVKILNRELAKDTTYLRRFEREAQAAASLVHANIVQIHEVGHANGLHYIAQEYVQGQNLRDWIARNGPADLPHALSIMRQVAAALAKAAEQGVVHRDIKPENIMLTTSGEVKVADFGLAHLSREDDAQLTQVGVTVGTPLYMSPEQVEGKSLDPRSDIYSLGVTCYHMLTGSPPFEGDTALAVAVQHLKKEPRPLQLARSDLPLALCRAVQRMLAKEPSARWQSAGELLRELCRIRFTYCTAISPEELGQWESAGVDPPAAADLQALERLSSLMQGGARRGGRWHAFRPLVAGLLFFAIGAAAAWFTMRDAPLLAHPPWGKSRVPRQSTVLRQWLYASQIGTQQAWQSVIDYFPEKTYVVLRAKQQLARIYLRERDYVRAMAVFDELAQADDLNKEFQAFGLAGKCGVLTLQEKYQESADVLDQLWPIHQELRDVQMRKMLDYVMRENRSKLGSQTARQWNEWLSEQFHSEG